MLEVAFRTDLEDFLLDVDVFGSGDVTIIDSSCFLGVVESQCILQGNDSKSFEL